MTVYEKIKAGLEEAIAFERGTLEAKVTCLSIDAIPPSMLAEAQSAPAKVSSPSPSKEAPASTR